MPLTVDSPGPSKQALTILKRRAEHQERHDGHRLRCWQDDGADYSEATCARCGLVYFVQIFPGGALIGCRAGMGTCAKSPESRAFAELVRRNQQAIDAEKGRAS